MEALQLVTEPLLKESLTWGARSVTLRNTVIITVIIINSETFTNKCSFTHTDACSYEVSLGHPFRMGKFQEEN